MFIELEILCLLFSVLDLLIFLSNYAEVNLGDLPGSPPAHRKSSQIQMLVNLEKQLAIEQRVKSGAETMITVYSGAKNRQERKLLTEAQQMFTDSKTKVEVLKMKIMKIKGPPTPERTSESASGAAGAATEAGSRSKAQYFQTPEGRVAILRYRIDVETRLMQGAKSIMKANPNDRKMWQTVSGDVWRRGGQVHLVQNTMYS